MARKTPVTVVTGFLGSGKTSLVRHLAEHAQGRRLAFVINEFGELGIDREVLLGCGIAGCAEEDVVELANGCLCCAVADDLVPTLRRLLDRPAPPDHIIIETSGLALPKPLVKAFGWPEVRGRATVDGVLSVVDAEAVMAGRYAADPEALARQRAADPTLDHDSPLEELFDEQAGSADLIVLNKADLVPPSERPRVEALARARARAGVAVVWCRHGSLDPGVALGLGLAAEDDLASRLSPHEVEGEHDHEDFESLALPVPPIADPARFEATLSDVAGAHGILRMKGFLAVQGRPARLLVQAVGPRIARAFDRPWREGEGQGGTLVVIGLRGLDAGAIRAAVLAGARAG